MSEPYRSLLLFIDDSRSQLQAYRQQMSPHFEVVTAETYEEAMATLTERTPDLIVLDMVMPQVDGLEFLDILKSTTHFSAIPVVMVSAELDPRIVRQAFQKGASDFVRKPYDTEELHLRIRRILNQPGRAAGSHEAEARARTAQSLLIRALADLSATRDDDTGFHLKRIEKYTGLVTSALAAKGLASHPVDGVLQASLAEVSVLHDIGKVGIPDAILRKPGPLDPEEQKVMRTHVTIGAETIERVESRFPEYEFLELAREVALYHHERWDGRGYPEGLAGEAIPLCARIVSVADVFDALTTPRVYKPAMSVDAAIDIMASERGTHFDPVLLDLFLDILPQVRTVRESLGDLG
jgi:putative two-component system response regulator